MRIRTMVIVLMTVSANLAVDESLQAKSGVVDVRILGGYALGLDDSPPNAAIVGGAVSARISDRWRLGVEILDANMFGPYETYKQRALLVTPVVEREFLGSQRFRPYAVIGFGFTQYRSLEPTVPMPMAFEWRKENSLNLAGGIGLRAYLTKRLFIAPEVRIGLLPALSTAISVGYSFQ